MMEASRWPVGEHPLSLAINVSAKQFEQPDFAETVSGILDRSGLTPSLLELELTESIAMRDPERVIERITPLKARGVRFAIDDFGTGYSSLGYLRNFPFDKIKIDQSFVRHMSEEHQSKAIVSAIAGLGGSFGIPTTAEGVETPEQLEKLRAEGCTEVQGFYFSPPRPATELAELISLAPGEGKAA